jgi:hypothetical protein
MIFESRPWKVELVAHLRRFKTWEGKLYTEKGGFYIERGVFLSAFIVRKLMENRKVTDVIRESVISVDAHRAKRPVSDRVSRFFGIADPSLEYDFERPVKISITAYELMNQIIHSYGFVPVVSKRGVWRGFLVNSYRVRDKHLLQIDRKDFEKLLTKVIEDHVWKINVGVDPYTDKVVATAEGKKISTRAVGS